MERKSPSLKVLAADGHGFGRVINVQRAGAADADFAHLPRHQRRVRADAAARGENAFGRNHAAQIFRRSFDANEQDFFAAIGAASTARSALK